MVKSACALCRWKTWAYGPLVECEKLGEIEARPECALQEIPVLPQCPEDALTQLTETQS
jgi:hypothetical protein